MQAFTTVTDMIVGDPSVTSRLARTSISEIVTAREVLSRVFDTNSASVAWRMLNDWFLPQTLAEKSKWKREFNDLVTEKKEEPMRFSRV